MGKLALERLSNSDSIFFRILGKVRKLSTFYRLHYQNRLVMLAAYLIAFSGLNLGIVIVQIVKLQLNNFNLWIFRQNLVQHFGGIMERNTHVPYFSFRFQL